MTTFAIVLAVQPHRLVFNELADSLAWGLTQMGHTVERVTWPVWGHGERNIILAPHLLLACDDNPPIPPGTIVYNFEPFCSPLFLRSLALLARKDVDVWDFWGRTTEYLQALGIPARTVPFGWYPGLVRPRAERDIDVLFFGATCPRRLRVLDELARLNPPGFVVARVFGVYGAERDGLLARAKVTLNIHYWDEGGCEDLRVLFAAANSVAVVSEGEPDEPHKRPWARWVPYSELAAECVELASSGAWKYAAALGRASVELYDSATILREALAAMKEHPR